MAEGGEEKDPAPEAPLAGRTHYIPQYILSPALSKVLVSPKVQELEKLPSDAELARQDKAQDIKLKKRYANWLLGIMLAQVLIANGVFIKYAHTGVDWQLEAGVIQAWLAATVVQVIGVVLVVVRYLFPQRGI